MESGGEKEEAQKKEQGKKVQFAEEDQPEETRAQNVDEQELTSGRGEVRTGRGTAGLVRGGDERRSGGKREHGSKGRLGSKGTQEAQQNKRTMKGADEIEEERTWGGRLLGLLGVH